MSVQGDNRKLHRARYHQWLRRRWQERAEQAAAKRAARLAGDGRRKGVAR